jgi:hypothetical protein
MLRDSARTDAGQRTLSARIDTRRSRPPDCLRRNRRKTRAEARWASRATRSRDAGLTTSARRTDRPAAKRVLSVEVSARPPRRRSRITAVAKHPGRSPRGQRS